MTILKQVPLLLALFAFCVLLELVDVIITKCLPQTPFVICIMCMFEIYISIQVTKKSKGMGPVDYDPNVIIRECIIYGVTDAETTYIRN